MKSIVKSLILFIFLSISFSVKAELVDESYGSDIQKAIPAMLSGMEKFEDNFYQNAQPVGVKLFQLLSIITLSLAGIKIAMSSGESLSEPMSVLIRSIFVLGIVWYVLTPDGYQLLVKGTIKGLTETLASIANGGEGDIKSGFVDFTTAQMDVLAQVWEKETESGFWGILEWGALKILGAVLLVLFIVFALIAFIAFLSATLVQSLAFAVGPVFLAFLAVEKTSFLFDGWVKFTISASLTKVVVAMLTAVGTFTFDSVAGSGSGSISIMIISVAAGGMIAFQMLRAPEIAQAMVSGGAISFARFVRLKK